MSQGKRKARKQTSTTTTTTTTTSDNNNNNNAIEDCIGLLTTSPSAGQYPVLPVRADAPPRPDRCGPSNVEQMMTNDHQDQDQKPTQLQYPLQSVGITEYPLQSARQDPRLDNDAKKMDRKKTFKVITSRDESCGEGSKNIPYLDDNDLVYIRRYSTRKSANIIALLCFIMFSNVAQLGKIISLSRRRHTQHRLDVHTTTTVTTQVVGVVRMGEAMMAFISVSLFLCTVTIMGCIVSMRADVRNRNHQFRLNRICGLGAYVIAAVIACNVIIVALTNYGLCP